MDRSRKSKGEAEAWNAWQKMVPPPALGTLGGPISVMPFVANPAGVTKLRPPTAIQFARLLDAWKRVPPSLDAPDPESRIFHLNFDVDWLGLLLIPFRPDLIIEMEKRFLPA